MVKYQVYENQLVPDKLNRKKKLQTHFLDRNDLLIKLRKAQKTNETIYAYCNAGDDKSGEIELSFLENCDDVIGYVLLDDITYDKLHVGRLIDCIDSVIGVKIIDVEDEVDGLTKVKCSRKEVVKEIHDKYNSDIKNGIFHEGLIVKGIITGMDYNKAYVDIGGDVTAILGVADISKVYVRQPQDILEVGQVIDLVVKKVYSDPIKISLSREMLLSGWENIERRFKAGKIVPGIVKNSMPTGIFIELSESFEGLAEDIPPGVKYNYGDRVIVKILTIDKKREKIKLKIIENK
ncbi:S1 RNA-binding domain-containing protein [Tissierella carlieri]|uniref:S1 RNA-binding domain-containing protein n=1 Tax=Tissierella carlieri TaxID=689904 RepID=A0ABT1SEI8_9FIRM|nr:S1 RNA-binding domain-containing protein [Tissierella carlieri]